MVQYFTIHLSKPTLPGNNKPHKHYQLHGNYKNALCHTTLKSNLLPPHPLNYKERTGYSYFPFRNSNGEKLTFGSIVIKSLAIFFFLLNNDTYQANKSITIYMNWVQYSKLFNFSDNMA